MGRQLYIYLLMNYKNQPNVGRYIIHGFYGPLSLLVDISVCWLELEEVGWG